MGDVEYMEKLERLVFGLLNSFEDLVHDLNLDQWEYEYHSTKLQELRDLAVDLT